MMQPKDFEISLFIGCFQLVFRLLSTDSLRVNICVREISPESPVKSRFDYILTSVYNGSRLWNSKKAIVNDYMYSCGSNCSTCSSEFQDESQVKPNFTDHENPCTGYCYFNQVSSLTNVPNFPNSSKNYFTSIWSIIHLTLRRPKQHRSQAPDVPDLAQTVKPWSDLFKIFTAVFARA